MVACFKGFLQIVHKDVFIAIRTFGREKRLEMPHFAAVSVDEHPFRQNISLRIVLFDIHASLQKVIEKRKESME